MPSICSGEIESAADGSTGAGRTRRPVAGMGREEAVHQRTVGLIDRGGGVDRGVRRRDAEQHGDVAELEVAVDDRDLLRGTRGQRDGEVRRQDALADATLGGEGDDDATELDRTAAGRGARADERVADPLDRLTQRGVVGVERERVPHAGTECLLQQCQRELLADQHHAHLGVLTGEARRLGEPRVVGEPGTEHDHGGPVPVQRRDQRLDRVRHGRFRRGQLDRQPGPEPLVGFDCRYSVSLRGAHVASTAPARHRRPIKVIGLRRPVAVTGHLAFELRTSSTTARC